MKFLILRIYECLEACNPRGIILFVIHSNFRRSFPFNGAESPTSIVGQSYRPTSRECFPLPVFYIPISLQNFPPLFLFNIPSISGIATPVYQVIIKGTTAIAWIKYH